MIKIDKGIPLPTSHRGGGKWPWREMEVGDSFLMPNTLQANASARAGAASNRIGNGVKFATRQVDGGVRIWRIE